jgi:hemerythrin superfamily protein
METTESYRVFLRPGLLDSQNLKETLKVSGQIREILKIQKVIEAIADVHKFGASSHTVQKSILEHMESLGFVSEKKNLFASYKVSGIRPDYFKPLVGGGILFEVERGKTIANNMDLLDVWKTHLCTEAKHLFLLVPKIRVTEKDGAQKIFNTVENRIETFFLSGITPIDVHSVHIFGY